jgi:D-sedoheptulose 7-phosphate isomerase
MTSSMLMFEQAFVDLAGRHPELTQLRGKLQQATELLGNAFARGRKVLVCGNGASAADAEHIVAALAKSSAFHRPLPERDRAHLLAAYGAAAEGLVQALEAPLPAISLVSQTALLTATANDRGFEFGFAQQVLGLADEGDVLLALSTSGNSTNIIQACRVARLRGAAILGMTGESGGLLASHADVLLNVPATQSLRVQELHLPVYHFVCAVIEERFFGVHGRR